MSISLRQAGATLALLSLTSAVQLSAQQVERRSLSGTAVTVHNVVGEVRVEGGGGGEVVVEIMRGGADGQRLGIESNRESLRITYPETRLVYPRMGNRSRSSIRMGDRSDDRWGRNYEVRGSGSGLEAWADMRILVPAGRTFTLRLGVGAV